MTESPRNMAWRLGLCKVLRVAAVTVGSNLLELVVDMTLSAKHGSMCPREREGGQVMVHLCRPGRSNNGMAPAAVDRETLSSVVWTRRCFKFSLVAADTGKRGTRIPVRRCPGMAGFAFGQSVMPAPTSRSSDACSKTSQSIPRRIHSMISSIRALAGFSVIVETVFSRPGLGRLGADERDAQDAGPGEGIRSDSHGQRG